MKSQSRLSTSDRILVTGAILCLLIAGYFLYNDDLLNTTVFSKAPEIGRITTQVNDTRLKTGDSLVWYKAREKSSIHFGDSVFAGAKSQAQVTLKKGGAITIGENSMVSFRDVDNQKLANLEIGNFRVKVEGEVKIAIGGTVTTLESTHSEVQVYLGDNKKAQIRVLRGKTKVKTKGKPAVELDLKTIHTIAVNPEPKKETASESSASVPPPLPDTPGQLSKLSPVSYTWKLYDLYEKKDLELIERHPLPESVQAPIKLTWSTAKTPGKSYVQLSNNADFQKALKLESSSGEVVASPVSLGENYWRVSYDGDNWSDTQRFSVDAHLLPNAAPELNTSLVEVPLIFNHARVSVELRAPIETLGFVVEASHDESFKPGQTKVFWANSSTFNVGFYQPGKYFYRFRSVSRTQELSEWSKLKVFRVFLPQVPEAPKLVRAKRSGTIGDEFTAMWKADDKVTVEVADGKKNIVTRFEGKSVRWRPTAPGEYELRAFAVDQYGQRSPPSKLARIRVEAKPDPLPSDPPPQTLAETALEEKSKRKPAAVESANSTKLERSDQADRNFKYKNTTVSLAGFLWSIQSSQQYYSSIDRPLASGLGIGGIHWWERSGFEANLKTGVIGFNKTGKETSLRDIELRYHYRFFLPFPFGLSRELQMSLFGGFENYSNAGTFITNHYDLFKFGTSLEFPWGRHFGGGGEFVGGVSSDHSLKGEISGHMDYYFNPDWALDLGYRLHLFQAGSAASAPFGSLPYREGYTELYSILKYHF